MAKKEETVDPTETPKATYDPHNVGPRDPNDPAYPGPAEGTQTFQREEGVPSPNSEEAMKDEDFEDVYDPAPGDVPNPAAKAEAAKAAKEEKK